MNNIVSIDRLGVPITPRNGRIYASGNYSGGMVANQSNNGIYALVGHKHVFADITNLPTTLAGYGIADSYTQSEAKAAFVQKNTSAAPVQQTIYGDIIVKGKIYASDDVVAFYDGSVEEDANPFDLPIASTTELGAVKIGTGLVITADGILSVTNAIATGGNADTLGGHTSDYFAIAGHTHAFADLTGKPTTLLGYEISSNDTLFDSKYCLKSNLGVASGIATLDAGGKIPLSQLPSSILEYQGTWAASTNSPFLSATDTLKKGYVYLVSVAGTQFGIDFYVGDWAIYNESGAIEKSDNSDDVISVNGHKGPVVLSTSDIAEGSNLYYTEARVAANATVQSAVNTANAALPMTGGRITGDLDLGGSALSFLAGTGDGANYSTYNIKVSGWNGLALANPTIGGAYPNQIVGILKFRDGILDMKGGFSVNGSTVWCSGNMGTNSGLDADKLDGKHFSEIESEISTAQDAAISAAATDATNKVNAVQFEERNLLIGSSNGNGWNYDSRNGTEFGVTQTSTAEAGYIYSQLFSLETNREVTISFESKESSLKLNSCEFFILGNWQTEGVVINSSYPQSTDWIKNVFTVTVPSTIVSPVQCRFDHNGTSDGSTATVYVRNVCLRYGNKDIGFTPPPEDKADVAGNSVQDFSCKNLVATASSEANNYVIRDTSGNAKWTLQLDANNNLEFRNAAGTLVARIGQSDGFVETKDDIEFNSNFS